MIDNRDHDLATLCIILFNVFGFITGITHEMLGAIFVLMIVAKGITLVYIIKSFTFMHYVRLHIGFFIGYCIVFFAPANFYRVQSIHSATEGSYFERLLNSLIIHLRTVFPTDFTQLVLVGVLAFIIVLCISFCLVRIIKTNQLNVFITENLYIIVGLVFSPILFALGPYSPNYGACLWNALFYILLFKAIFIYADISSLIPDIFYKLRLGVICAVISLSLFILLNAGWFSSFVSTALEWEESISFAKQHEYSSVSVPLFSEGPSSNILSTNIINNPNRYEMLVFREYFGILVIPE